MVAIAEELPRQGALESSTDRPFQHRAVSGLTTLAVSGPFKSAAKRNPIAMECLFLDDTTSATLKRN